MKETAVKSMAVRRTPRRLLSIARESAFERSMRGTVLIYLTLIVLLPLLALTHAGLSEGVSGVFERITSPIAKHAIVLTLWTSALVAAINTVFGVATAWLLFRYRFPGKRLLNAIVDLPLAIPTLVTGLMITVLYGPGSLIGERFEGFGIQLVFAKPAIVLALLFVTFPFVVRAVEPLLEEIDPSEEEAAILLGADPIRIFRTVYLPVVLSAAVSSGIRSFGRAVGEFGSIVVVAGNIPFETLTAPIYVFGEIESGAPESAAAVSLALLLTALSLHVIARVVERQIGARHA